MTDDIVDQLIAAAARHSGGVDGELPNLLEMAAYHITMRRREIQNLQGMLRALRAWKTPIDESEKLPSE